MPGMHIEKWLVSDGTESVKMLEIAFADEEYADETVRNAKRDAMAEIHRCKLIKRIS